MVSFGRERLYRFIRMEGVAITTNVMDRRASRVTSDSRWSLLVGDELYFVDNTGFDKITNRVHSAMVCAGSAVLIEQWKSWFEDDAHNLSIPPTEVVDSAGNIVQCIYVAILRKPDFNTLFISGAYYEFEDAAKFCGSGAEFAKDCYSANGCSTKCIESAALNDPQTGGEIKFVDFKSMKHNLSNPAETAQQMFDQLANRGMVMDLKTKKVSPINASQQSVQAVAQANAHLLSAPTGQIPRAWTEREKHDVKKAKEQILELERAANT